MSEIVIKEVRRPRTWYFDDGFYISRDDQGNVWHRIGGDNLPNPLMIKGALEEQAKYSATPDVCRKDADPVTYALWNHWNTKGKNAPT